MQIGGIQKALVEFIENLLEDGHKITLFLFDKSGQYLNKISDEVEIITGSKILKIASMSLDSIWESRNIFAIVSKYFFAILIRIFGNRFVYKLIFKSGKITPGYDLAISYSQDNYNALFAKGCNQFVAERIIANKKIAFLHADITREIIDWPDMYIKYKPFDAVISVSEAGKNQFSEMFPMYANKSYYLHNFFDVSKLQSAAREYIPFYNDNNEIILVTVSRLSYLKGIDRIILAAEYLLKNNVSNFKWYIVGDGVNEYSVEKLNEKIKILGLDNNLFFVGYRSNPYPFFYHADAFILPSITEAFPLVVTESLILQTPVIACRYAAHKEQIIDQVNGLILDNTDDSIAKTLLSLLANNDQLLQLKNNTHNFEYNNQEIKKEFYHILNELM